MSNQEAVKRINKFKANPQATYLDLSNLGLTEIPEEIEKLNGYANLKGLYLQNNQIEDLERLANFKNLLALDLSNNQSKDISKLSNLEQLMWLNLANNQIFNISVLGELENNPIKVISIFKDLIWLNLSNNQIEDINALGKLKNLTELDLSKNQIKDINALGKLKNLTELNLSKNQIKDIDALKDLTNLMILGLSNNQISDILPLNNLTSLVKLHLHQNQIKQIDSISALIKLEELSLGNNQITDIEPLKQLECLKKLYLNKNQIKNINSLEKLNKNLVVLGLDYNQIDDISLLANFKELTNLGLANNKIEDILALENLNKLKHLDLSNNPIKCINSLISLRENLIALGLNGTQISDIKDLSNLTNLKFLGLKNNKIEDVSILSQLQQLEKLDISKNKISDRRAWESFFAKGLEGKNALFFVELAEKQKEWLDEKDPKGIISLQKLPLLEDLWIKNNKISEADFSEMPKLKKVYLGNNPIESIKTGANAIEISFESEVKNNSMLSFVPELMQHSLNNAHSLNKIKINTEETKADVKTVKENTEEIKRKLIDFLSNEWVDFRTKNSENFETLCTKLNETIVWNDIATRGYPEKLQNEWGAIDTTKLFKQSECENDLQAALYLFDVIEAKGIPDYSPCILMFCRALEMEIKGFFVDFANSSSFVRASYHYDNSNSQDREIYDFLCTSVLNPTPMLNHITLGAMKKALTSSRRNPKHQQVRDYFNTKFISTKTTSLINNIRNNISTNGTSNKILWFRNKSAHAGRTLTKADAEICKNLVFGLLKEWINAQK